MKEPLKVGVIGVGSLGEHHAEIYSQLDSAELVGIYDADRNRATAIAGKYGGAVFDSVEALADSVEAASVVVPTDRHREIAMPLLERGIHLLVEKPIAATIADAEAMVQLAQNRGVILQVGHVERFNPVMKSLEKILDRPRFIEAIRLAPYPMPRKDLPPRGTEVSVVLDLMIHDLEIILHLVKSDIREIHAVGVPVLSPTEDIVNVRLCFANGCVANLSASRISREKTRKIRVFQKDAYVSLDYQNQSGSLCRKTPEGIVAEEVPVEKEQPLRSELATFVKCVINRDEPVVTGKNAFEALKLAVAICEHIRKGGS